MKKISHLFLSAVGLLLLTACGSSASFTIDYFAFKQKSDGKWGMINAKGEVLFENEFKNAPTVSINDRFAVQNKKEFYEFYETDDQPEQIGEGVAYKEVGMFTGKYAPVQKKDGRIIYLDKKGGVAIDMAKKFPGKKINEVECFLDDWAKVQMDGKYGAIDLDGKLIVPCKYNDVRENFLVADRKIFIDEEANKWYVIDHKGKTLLTKPLENMQPHYLVEGGLIVVRIDDEEVILDEKGNTKLKLKNKRIDSEIFDGKFVYGEDDSYGMMDVNGKILFKAKYDRIDYNGAIIVAREDDEWFIVDEGGKKKGSEFEDRPMLLSPVFDGYDSFFFVKNDGEYSLLDDEGKEVKIDVDLKEVEMSGQSSIYIWENNYDDYDEYK